MDFDKDNFEEENELAPLEEEEAGEVDEVVGVETDPEVSDEDAEDEPEAPKRAGTTPKRGSVGAAVSGRAASKAPTRKSSGGSAGRKSTAKRASVGRRAGLARKSAAKKSGSKSGGKKGSKKPVKKSSRASKKKRR